MTKPKPPAIHCAHAREVPITELLPHPANPNRHSAEQVRLLAKIIAHQGWRSPITVSKRSGCIVAGHGRLEAARLLGLTTVPVDEQDFASDADEIAHLIADNRIHELAELDRAALRELAESLDSGDFDMDATGFDAVALEELMTAAPPDDTGRDVTIGETREVIVECDSEDEQRTVFDKLSREGRKCRLSTF